MVHITTTDHPSRFFRLTGFLRLAILCGIFCVAEGQAFGQTYVFRSQVGDSVNFHFMTLHPTAYGETSRTKIGRLHDPAFALKTNLLFDAVTALNLEVEIPINERWSATGELIFPWWLVEKKQNALEAGIGTLEGRYWFGDREQKLKLTGWFAGVYGGAGYYDIEWGDGGRQGELWHTGLSGGYAHTIGRSGNWRLEYSLGLGYMYTKYRKYIPSQNSDGSWNLVPDRRGTLHWVGPTRAKVSLVWMIPYRFWKKGAWQ